MKELLLIIIIAFAELTFAEQISAHHDNKASVPQRLEHIIQHLSRSLGNQPTKDTDQKVKIEQSTENKGNSTNDINKSGFSLSVSKSKRNQHPITEILNNAYEAHKLGQIESALQLYQNAIKIDPKNNIALLGVASIYQEFGLNEEAKEIYLRILEHDSLNFPALNNLFAIIGEESPIIAINYLNQIEKEVQDHAFIPAQLGLIYLRLKDYKKAINSFKKSLLIEPDNINYKYNLALAYDMNGSTKEAITLYKEILNLYYSGIILPDTPDKIYKRMTFLNSKK